MKYVKKRKDFLKESDDIIKKNALEILSDNSDDQTKEVKEPLKKLDSDEPGKKVVTRFAPSSTGFLHIGGIRTALYNYLFAKKHDGLFYLRIEDTDQTRFVEGSEEYIRRSLEWCGIEPEYAPWNPGPKPYDILRQSERNYSKHIKTLLDKGMAYYAFDTKEEIDKQREKDPYFSYNYKNRMFLKNSLSLPKKEVDSLLKSNTPHVIRFKTPENETITFNDIVRGNVSMNTEQTDDKVLIKSDGIPTYHMANVCDDHDMKTTHVIRGEEWLPSTPLHIMLYKAFGWDIPKFAHLPLILNPDGRGKLSKRKALSLGIPAFPLAGEGEDDKGKSVKYLGFKDEGYEPSAVLNFLALLGWTPSDEEEVMTLADMISKFDIDSIHKSGAKFDIDKAKYFNQQHISKYMTDEEILNFIDTGNDYQYSKEDLSKIIDICKKRSTFVKEIQKVADIFFKPINTPDPNLITEDFKKVFNEFLLRADAIIWEEESVKQLIYDICAEIGLRMGKIMPILRIAITGGMPGPDLMSTMVILGKNESINRIKNVL